MAYAGNCGRSGTGYLINMSALGQKQALPSESPLRFDMRC
jgi:hypothetical protein